MGLFGERHPKRDVQGIGIFLRRADAPAFPRRIAGDDSPVRAVWLDEVLPAMLAQEPDNPWVAVLAPLVIASDAALAAEAPALWQRVRAAPISPGERDTLSDVLLFWFMERFKTLTQTEVRAMLNLWTAIEETSGYQAIKAEGLAEGLTEAKTDALTRLLTRRFGSLPAWAVARIAGADLAQLDGWLDGLLDAADLTALLGPADDPACH